MEVISDRTGTRKLENIFSFVLWGAGAGSCGRVWFEAQHLSAYLKSSGRRILGPVDLLKTFTLAFLGGSDGKESTCQCRKCRFYPWVRKTQGMAIHSNILAWRIPWTEEPGRVQSMGSHRVRHDWATTTYHFIHVYKNCPKMEEAIFHRKRLQLLGAA